MDSADQDPPSSRPKRDLRLPEHLAEYDVVLLPSQQPAAQVSSLPVGQPGKRKPSRTGSASGYQSSTSSRRSSRLSLGSQLLKNMPDVKAAALEEQIRVMELADLQQEIEEEREADLEAKKLEEQVKEGQRMQEEAYLAKERMAKEMGRRRRLKKLEKEIKIASAVKCFLSESEDEAKDRLFHLPMLLSIQHSHSSTQIRQLVQSELGSILNSPAIKSGDAEAFDSFALSVQSLVSMLRTLEGTVGYELRCGSHVDRLLSKMSPAHRDGFVEYCLCRGILQPGTDITYTLPDLAAWLQMKAQAKRLASRATHLYNPGPLPSKREQHGSKCKDRAASVFLCSETTKDRPTTPQKPQASKFTPYCPFCNNKEHYLNSCLEFKKLNLSEIKKWIQEGDRCFKCGRNHKAAACTLKRPCKTCKETHLTVLHDVIQELSQRVLTVSHREPTVYIEQPRSPQRVLLKIVKVLLQHGNRTLETFAVLDDGSERSILLPHAVEQLQLIKHPETLHLRTVQQEVKELHGSSVSFHVSPIFKPNKRRSLHPPTLLPRQPASVRRQSERMTREIGCQTDRVIARHANVQANVKLSRRSQGCQTLFPSPSLNVNQDIPETSQIKEEPEEQCIKQEEEQLQEPVVEPKVECVKIEPSMFQQTEDSMEIKEEDINADSSEPGNYEPMVECVKIEPSMFQQTEDSKEIKGEDINADSSEPGNHDDWRSSLSCADVEMEADGEDFHKDQITAESMTAHNTSQSSNFQSAAETSAAVNPGDLCTEARGEGKKRYQALVTARLSAAAEDIFALFERTIADYEKELRLCKEKLRRQEQLETLRPRVRTPGVQMPSQSPDLSLNQTSPVKQERAEQSVRREPVLDSSVEGEDINADSEDWRTSFSCSDVQKEADGNGVQVAAHSTTAQNSGLLFNYKSAAEASVPVNTEDMSAEAQGDDERKYQCDVYGAAPTEHKPFS
uniref:Gag-like protein n=1 Tax=Knipowitschia caucasica TaxID=637954 RepID=A0AAV2M4R5_KNICA